MKKKILLLLLFLFVVATSYNCAEAKTYKRGNFLFEYKSEDGEVWITKITPLSSKGIETLNIPGKLDGEKVVKLGGKGDDVEGDSDDYTSLFGVYTLEEETGLFPEKIHKRVSNIKKIHIPSTVREITYNCFNYIQDGKSINIPKEVEENVEHLAMSIKWSKFKISKNNYKYKVENGCLVSQDGGYLYGLINKTKRIKKLVIPETVKIIPVFMQTWEVDEINMPAGMKDIALYGPTTKKPVRVKIGKGSKTYAVKEGSIYNRITGRLVSGYVKNGVLKIPSKITSAGNNGYLGPKPSKIIIPSSVREIIQLLGMTDSKNFVCVCKGKKPPKLVDEEGSVTVKNMTIYVPKNCKKIYEKKWKSEWKYISGLKVSIIEQ